MRWLLLVGLTLCACKKDPAPVAPAPPPPRPAPQVTVAERDQAFWSWVRAHAEELKAVQTGQEPVIDGLTIALAEAQPGAVFELGVGKDPFELIISADGEKARFPAVRRLVAAAPELPGVKVIAFRPRKDLSGFTIDVDGRRVSGKDVWFTAEADPDRLGRVGLNVYVSGWDEEKAEAIRNVAFILLEATVGELDLETKVGFIEIDAAPEKPMPPLRPLSELPAVLDGWK